MTFRLTTDYAKNYCNRTLIVKVIVENVVTCFLLGHIVHISELFVLRVIISRDSGITYDVLHQRWRHTVVRPSCNLLSNGRLLGKALRLIYDLIGPIAFNGVSIRRGYLLDLFD